MIDAKRKAIIFLTISFLLAVATAGVILVQINDAQKELGEMVQVASASRDIETHHEILEADIEWVDLPVTSAFDSFLTKQEFDNRSKDSGVIALVELKEGELMTDSLVREKIDIPANERVVQLDPSENVLLDQELSKGDLVDIIAVYQGENDRIETKRILSSIPVVQGGSSGTADNDETSKPAKVSLSVEDATKLIHQQNTAVQIRVLRINQATNK